MTKYLIDNEEVSKEVFDSNLEDAVRNYVEEYYDDILDECYDEIEIGCCTFTASQILKNCDPIAYNCGISDEVDVYLSDAQYDLECGRTVEYDRCVFEIVEEEDEEEDE